MHLRRALQQLRAADLEDSAGNHINRCASTLVQISTRLVLAPGHPFEKANARDDAGSSNHGMRLGPRHLHEVLDLAIALLQSTADQLFAAKAIDDDLLHCIAREQRGNRIGVQIGEQMVDVLQLLPAIVITWNTYTSFVPLKSLQLLAYLEISDCAP